VRQSLATHHPMIKKPPGRPGTRSPPAVRPGVVWWCGNGKGPPGSRPVRPSLLAPQGDSLLHDRGRGGLTDPPAKLRRLAE
jgi:hypothetical protein